MTKPSYHDFVFRQGQLIGQFERMYQESDVIPWRQDETATSWWADVALSLIRKRAPFSRAIDIGCGLGYFTERLVPLCDRVTGVDVSPTAVRDATARCPAIRFEVVDITQPVEGMDRHDLVVVKDLFWYTFPYLSQVLANLEALNAPGGWLFVQQSFPPLDRPFVGRDVIPTPDRLLELLTERGELDATCDCREAGGDTGPMFMALLSRRRAGTP